jgi:hypothetical protein
VISLGDESVFHRHRNVRHRRRFRRRGRTACGTSLIPRNTELLVMNGTAMSEPPFQMCRHFISIATATFYSVSMSYHQNSKAQERDQKANSHHGLRKRDVAIFVHPPLTSLPRSPRTTPIFDSRRIAPAHVPFKKKVGNPN